MASKKHTNTARGRNKRITSPVYRLGLTHGQEGVPKFIRENSDQFFAAATRRKSKVIPTSKPLISTESQQQQQQQYSFPRIPINNNDDQNESKLSTSISNPLTSVMKLPPIRTASSRRPKAIPSASACAHPTNFLPPIASSSLSFETSTPGINSPTQIRPLKRPFRPNGPVDQDIFRKAYDRALSVARSRLLFHDPYSLTRASATHGILYSYYDHTPMCIFSRGNACNHRQDKTYIKQERKLKSNVLRKKIFNDVVVENYIR